MSYTIFFGEDMAPTGSMTAKRSNGSMTAKRSIQMSPHKEVRRPVWAEVSLSALTYNLQAIRKYVNPQEEKRKTPRKILSIVKGNGYGHGGPEVAKALEKAGSDWFGVTCTDEGIAVRQAGVRKPILILTSFVPGEESRLVEHDLTAVIHRCEQLALLDRLRALGIDPGIVHLANSAAIVTRPETWADMVRPGAILYGYHPGYDPIEKRDEAEARLPLKPVMSLRSRIISVRNVAAGDGVGYDATFMAQRPTRIGVLAAGYGDGIHRSLGNRGNVLLRGKLAPIAGIISIDVNMIDVTDIEGAEVGDVATIHGTDGTQVLPANRVARSIGTVTSDLLCAVSQRVPRLYVR